MFDQLPPARINYPIVNFPTIPRPPVVPTAALASDLAQNATQVAAIIDPNARKQMETELAILGAKLRSDNQNSEIQQLQMNILKQNLDALKKSQGNRASTLDKSFGANPINPPPVSQPGPLADTVPDTTPQQYYDNLGMKSPGRFQFTLGPQEEGTPLPTQGDYTGPDTNEPDTEELS